ncbi:MAG: hypothetical protein ACW98Y_19110 [Candidatus Thorarchaeota archaeon]
MRNQTPFLLCLIAGLVLWAVGYTHGVNTIVLVYILVHSIAVLAPFYLIIDIILFILFLIAWAGGFAIIVGGILLTTSYVRLGKVIIAISAGFGLISLILVVLWVVITNGLLGLLVLTWLILHTAWALALVLTVIARSMAE